MISETRTKITSWLRSPKSLAAKLSIGAVVAIAAGVPAVSALVADNQPIASQNSVASAENEQKTADIDETAGTDTPQIGTSTPSEGTESTETGTNSAPAGTTESAAQQNTAPAAPVYSDSYPADWKNQCGQIDTWGQTKCQSTSYAAWKVSEAGLNMPKYWGDASTWPAKADAANIPRGSTPKLHSVAVTGNFNAFVEAVNGDTITVSWYNWGNTGQYGTWENIPASQFTTYIYF